MIISVLGPQGSGKSTQAELLAAKLNLPYLKTGKILRQLALLDTPEAKTITSYLNQGTFLPDELLFPILRQELAQPKYANGFIIDGTPRFVTQALTLPFQIDKVILINLTDEAGTARLLKRAQIEHRPDDTPQIIKDRLALYHQETEPVLAYYRRQGKLIEVDGSPAIEVIFADICRQLNLPSSSPTGISQPSV